MDIQGLEREITCPSRRVVTAQPGQVLNVGFTTVLSCILHSLGQISISEPLLPCCSIETIPVLQGGNNTIVVVMMLGERYHIAPLKASFTCRHRVKDGEGKESDCNSA